MKKGILLLLAGIAIGILVAPDKGSSTWNKIVDGLDDLKEKAVDGFNDLVDQGKDLVDKGARKAKKYADNESSQA